MGRTPFHGEPWTRRVQLDSSSDEPLFRQLATALTKSIRGGRPAAGDRMPSTRALAAELGISRMTVLAAMNKLRADGLITPRGGSGTYVAESVPTPSPSDRSNRLDLDVEADRLTARAAKRASQANPFALGGCHPRDFPFHTWSKSSAMGVQALADGRTAEVELRAVISEYVGATRGIRCTPDQIVLTATMRQSLKIAAQWIMSPGEIAWVEDPCSPGTRQTLQAQGAKVIPVPVGEDGFDVFKAGKTEPGAKLVVTTPRRTFPLGVRMSAARRSALLAWADSTHGWVLEDDFDAEFDVAFESHQPLAAGNRAGNVVYMSGFDRVLAPVGRLSYLVLPSQSLDGMAPWSDSAERMRDGGWPAPHFLSTLTAFMRSGQFTKHVAKLRSRHDERRDVLLSAIEDAQLDLEVDLVMAGEHVVVRLPDGTSDVAAAAALAQSDINVSPLSEYRSSSGARPGLVLGYATHEQAELVLHVQRLTTLLPAVLRQASEQSGTAAGAD